MIYTLTDTTTDSFISRGDNFNTNWMSLIQSRHPVKFAPVGMDDFIDGDMVIVYLDNAKPYGSYKIPTFVKRIFITGRINGLNVNYLTDADYVVYTNDIQRRIVEDIAGIHKPCMVMPKHPTPTFFDIDLQKQNRVFIGGRLSSEKTSGFYTRLLNLHKKYDPPTSFYIMGVDDSVTFKSYCDSLTKWLMDSPLNGVRKVNLEFNARYYKIMQIQIAASKYIHLWRDEPSIDTVLEMLDAGNQDILNHTVGESSLLGIAKRFACEVDVERTISFISHFRDQTQYEFKNLADDLSSVFDSI